MSPSELLRKLELVLEDAKTGILCTKDANGMTHMRWMTPAVIKGRPGTLFTVTCPDFKKIDHLKVNNEVEWMIQTRALDQVLHIRGRVNILDNPSIKAEIMENIGNQLTVFWKVNCEQHEFIVLETVIREAVYFLPMKGHKEIVQF